MKRFFNGIFLLLLLSLTGCSFIASFTEEPEENITLSFDKNKTSLSMGAMEVINVKASEKQNSASISWSYDDSVIFAKTDNYSAVITGLKPGSTTLTARCGSNSASCIITVSADSYAVTVTNPYVYASSDFVSVKPNETVKISAALFGGTVADINGFSWSIDKTSVASLSTEGNYCWITGMNDGIAKVTVKHNKAAYGYSVLVNCSSDGTNQCYITTTENIITINLSEDNTASFAIDLMNPLVSDYASGFTYSVVDSLGNEMSSKPVVVSGAGSLNVSLTAYSVGECYVRCKHPSAIYDLDVLVRVIENAETAYIEPSQTLVTVSDDIYQNISLSLLNYAGHVNPASYSWSFSENASEYIDYSIYNGEDDDTGDNINIKGKKTGTVKITVSYPGVPSRNIIVLVRNIDSEASDATYYISTSQNYIRMKEGDSPQQINISLKNASSDEISNLKWTITNDAADGSREKVINWKSGNGTAVHKFASRSVIANNSSAYAVIEPLKEGMAYIDISHPKAMYSTRITVVVTKENTVVEKKSVLNLTSSPVLNIKNGESSEIDVSFSGDGEMSEIVWQSEGAATVSGNANHAVVTAPQSGSGGSRSIITVTHPYATYPVKYTVVCYDNESDFEQYAVKTIYSYSTNETINTDSQTTLHLETSGFTSVPQITWNITQGSSCVSLSTENQNKDAVVNGLKPGKAVIKASVSGCDDVTFVVTVVAAGVLNQDADCYLSTSSNVLYFEDINKSKSLSVDLFNISSTEYSKLNWTLSNSNYEITYNGNQATVTSMTSEGSAVLTISHPLSQNILTVNLRTGNQFEYKNEDFCYITTNQDVFELYSGQEEVTLVATLNHTEESDDAAVPQGFSFECEDNTFASISYVNYSNTCYIKPLKNGTTKIFVRHSESDFEKEVVVIVNNAPNDSTIPYLTTTNNVITVVQGEYATATVTLMNSNTVDNSAWHWTSLDSRICDVIANNGTSAMLSANSPGTAEIKVTHKDCPYSLKLIVTVFDSSVIVSRPYISTSANIITLQKGMSTTLTAEMIGGNTASDSNYFRFVGSSSSMILVNSVSGSCYIKALNKGMAYVTVYNSRYSESYSKTVLVVIEDKIEDGVYIKPSTNIIKIKPSETTLTTVSAELVNGEVTDGKDFIWWADDYNLIGITPVAEQCSIMPTGKTGTTKLHIKHAKSSKQVDILVMISNYDTFAFSQKSANITAEKLYFYPLQIPSVDGDFEVHYSSSNEDVCLIQGSNAVAWVCGRSYGTASLTANMTSSDGTVLATTEMLVSVTEVDPAVPVISLGNSILTVEAGTSRVISATITGEGIEATEKFNLKWSVKNKDKGISLMDETPDKTAYGSDCYVTFNYGGEFVLSCTHEATGANADIYFIVEEKGEIGIELNSNLETMFKDDGSISLTATLTNATEADYKNITWSAVKVGGQNIVAVSKAKGAICTVTPKNVGQTTVIAKLPNGNTASCIVIVKANTEVTMDVGSIHVIPGYTEVINYRTNPENATINWYTQMTTGASSLSGNITNYFSIEDDTAKRQLRITGLLDYPNGAAGTITASMVGASAANLPTVKVYVEYDVEVKLQDLEGNNLTVVQNTEPDTKNVKKFNIIYYPTDLTIDIKKDSKIIASIPNEGNKPHTTTPIPEVTVGDVSKEIITEEGFEKCKMTVTLVPHTECSFDLSVSGTLPSDEHGVYAETKTFYYTAYYEKGYDIELINMTQNGAFTQPMYDSEGKLTKLVIGDGEEAVFYLKIKNENAAGKILNIKSEHYVPDSGSTGGRKDIYMNNNSYVRPGTSRLDKAKNLFEGIENNENIYKISANNLPPSKGLVYLTSEADVIPNATVYHLGHGWDYYKDLPQEVTGDNWSTYRNNNNYSNDFIRNLKNKGVDYWLVSKEIVVNNAYSFLHPGKSRFSSKWDEGVSKQKISKFLHYEYKFKGWVDLKFNNVNVFSIKNNDDSYNYDISNSLSPYYKTVIPFVITTEELVSSNLVRPDKDLDVGYKKTKGIFWDENSFDSFGQGCSSKIKLSKLISSYITPTVSKEKESVISLGKAKLQIPYEDGHGVEQHDLELNIEFIKRECEAYTSNTWIKKDVSGKLHWYLSDNLYDSSAVSTQPYLNIMENYIEKEVTEVVADVNALKVEYQLYPKEASLTVTIPPSNGTGNLKISSGATLVTTQSDGTKIYSITSHETTSQGAAGGHINFSLDGSYVGKVTIKGTGSSLNQINYLNFNITNKDLFVPEITSKTSTVGNVNSMYSYINKPERILVLGDGETVKGKIINEDSSSKTIIKSVSFENNMEDLVAGEVTKNTSGVYEFKLTNNVDYGYFAYSGKVRDKFYSNNYSLSDVSVTSADYETVYLKDSEGNLTKNIDVEKTEKNRQNAIKNKLNQMKISYMESNIGIPKTSHTHSYHYENYEYIESSKTYSWTDIGKFIITYNGEEGEETNQEIIIGLKITEGPCAKTSDYGIAVPASYYLNVTE